MAPHPTLSIRIRPALSEELALCRALLGREGIAAPTAHLFVAEQSPSQLIGCGVVREAEDGRPLHAVHVEAQPSFRGRGVEEGLLAYARAYAATHGVEQLQTLRWFEQGSADEQSWLRRGFQEEAVRYVHEVDLIHSYQRLAPLIQQIREHDWIPADAKVISLAEADPQSICELHVNYLGGTTELLLPLLDRSQPSTFDFDASVVLLIAGKPMGFTLGGFPEASVCEASANVLHPSLRLGWADMLLKYSALERVLAKGATVFRFITAERHSDSRRTLAWVGAGTTKTEVRLQTATGQPLMEQPPLHL
jgi:GNAT superfamily N-acetyltransferase